MLQFDESGLRNALGQLDGRRRLLFAALIATRLAAAYRRYCLECKQGDEIAFGSALTFVWEQLQQEDIDLSSAESYLERVMQLIPSEEEAQHSLWAQAGDAASALAYALRCLTSAKPEEAAWTARCAYETVDNLVTQKPEVEIGGKNEKTILGSRLIQEELHQQALDLAVASSLPLLTEDIRQASESARRVGETFFAEALGR